MGYKVLFLALSKYGKGFWLRYTTLQGLYKRYSASWITVFGYGRPRGFMVKVGEEFKISDKSVSNSQTLFSLKDEESSAMIKDYEWFLEFKKGGKLYISIPLLYRLIRRKSKYAIVEPNTTFKGIVRLRGEEFGIELFQGMIGYISGDRYLDHWLWYHCSGFEEDMNGWVDILVASPNGKQKVLFGLLKYNKSIIHIGRLIGIPYKGELELGKFNTSIDARGYRITLDVTASKDNMIVAKYEDPLGGVRYCHNTEIADSTLTLEGNGKKIKLTCNKRAFYEYALARKIDENLPEVQEVDV
jgi:hypothetical protein